MSTFTIQYDLTDDEIDQLGADWEVYNLDTYDIEACRWASDHLRGLCIRGMMQIDGMVTQDRIVKYRRTQLGSLLRDRIKAHFGTTGMGGLDMPRGKSSKS